MSKAPNAPPPPVNPYAPVVNAYAVGDDDDERRHLITETTRVSYDNEGEFRRCCVTFWRQRQPRNDVMMALCIQAATHLIC